MVTVKPIILKTCRLHLLIEHVKLTVCQAIGNIRSILTWRHHWRHRSGNTGIRGATIAFYQLLRVIHNLAHAAESHKYHLVVRV